MSTACIRVGIGGWTYEPWRETFYPPDLPKKSELHYASRQVTAIEINGTFYRLQTPAVFEKWRDETPDEFVFTVKAPRYITHRRDLASSGESIAKFLDSGIDRLRQRLGAILWQLPPTKAFVAAELDGFLKLLPPELAQRSLQHALEVRHDSFKCIEYIELARRYGVATVFTHDEEYPGIADATGGFVYARLRQCDSSQPTGYSESALREWAERARTWASGEAPSDLPRIDATTRKAPPRDVFVFFINGAKERAPAAARHLISILYDERR
jgi:uncharacterized protein YecE (DUF72 family)